MTVNEFLIEEINRRAEAAKVLSDDIKINDVDISGGCYSDGIRLWCGIEQVARCGNAVTPPVPCALVRANLPEMCGGERASA